MEDISFEYPSSGSFVFSDKIFLSFIIPVYNAERYLAECLDSCLDQDLDKSDYEIICINDGSIDNSFEILKGYAKKNSNFFIIDQSNSGVAAARNKGIELARGEYIWFVDSDDFIRKDCLHELQNIVSSGYDVIKFGGYSVSSELDIKEYDLLRAGKFAPNKIYWGYATFGIYRRDIIVNSEIYFNSSIKYGEDEVFNNDVFEVAKKMVTLEHTNYYYRKNPTSAMNTLLMPENQIKRLESVIISIIILKNGIESGKYSKDFSKEFLQDRYELVQYCFKRIPIKKALPYFKQMQNEGLFNYKNLYPINLPNMSVILLTYIKQHLKIWSRAFYKRSRSKIKNILPKSLVKIIKNIFRMPD